MSRLGDVHQFAEQARKVVSTDELSRLVGDMAREMGYRYFAIAHHVDHRVHNEGVALIQNYPPMWAEYFHEQGLYHVDPIFSASERASVGFAWSDLPHIIDLKNGQRDMLLAAKQQNVFDGFTVPIHMPGEPSGSCNFATPVSEESSPEQRMLAQLVGAFAFEAARRLTVQARNNAGIEKVRLTERQRECLIMAARGMSDSEIGGVLGVSEETVRMHLKAARERYGATRRITLAVRALYDGQVCFHEVF